MSRDKDLVNEFLDYKEQVTRCSKHTIRAYRNDLNQYLDFLYKFKSNILNSESNDIQHYLIEIGRKT